MIFSGKYKEEVMAKEPWEEDIYDDGEETLKRTSKLNGIKADGLLTILAIIFYRWKRSEETNERFLQW